VFLLSLQHIAAAVLSGLDRVNFFDELYATLVVIGLGGASIFGTLFVCKFWIMA
jgi:hypothetical protein